MTNVLEPIVDANLSVAWTKGFLKLMDQPGGELTPFIVCIRGFSEGLPPEDDTLKELLDRELTKRGCASCDTVANTIFPWSLWNPNKDASELYQRYNAVWPRIKRVHANRRGVYFQRLIDFGETNPTTNQLDHIISTWKRGNHRHSALQAGVFDPRKDHNHARQLGFPCLHQIAFSPLGPNGKDGLAVTGFYATQTMFEKAYGNFLGLSRLGYFMSAQLGIQLTEVTCVAALEKLSGGLNKKALGSLAKKLSAKIAPGQLNDRGGT